MRPGSLLFFLLFFVMLCFSSTALAAGKAPQPAAPAATTEQTPDEPETQTSSLPLEASPELAKLCQAELQKLPGAHDPAALENLCAEAVFNASCKSEQGLPIFHWNKAASPPAGHRPLKILVFGMIHGDEPWSGSLARLWAERLTRISPRNEWRIVPILNPDGWERKTRTNSQGVDLNRNFPTQDWDAEALNHWAKSTGKNPRRFPGTGPGSEAETRCTIWQIEDFRPDFVISVHTPYGVLDFDGPNQTRTPASSPLPWRRLGNYPGSLGRYLWKERQTPVLTIELLQQKFAPERYARLQDELSEFAMRTVEELTLAAAKQEIPD